MTDDELGFLPATELAPMIRQRKISPVEVVGAVLQRIERLEPRVNAFAYLAADRAMDLARKAEAELMSGRVLGPLHGLTVTIKDLSWTKDMPVQSGSKTQAGNRVAEDSPMVERLQVAGAINLGKTTTSEFGWSGISNCPLTGITHNPWKHGYNAGASSAGAGAAAAAGYGALHQGSDGAGSVRMPSHFCGIFGLKPTYGRVPYHPVGAGDYTSHIGPMTRTVADSALMMAVMSGPHPLDHTTMEAGPADYLGRLDDGVRGKRAAFSMDLGHARVDPDVAALVRAGAEAWAKDAGVELVDITPPWGTLGPVLAREFWAAHMSRLSVHLPEWENQMDPHLVACIKEGAVVTMPTYQAMRARKYDYIAQIHHWFENWDFLITPTVSVAAFPADRIIPAHWPQHAWDWLQWAEFSYPFNMSGNPAATVPCGFTAAGLPVGMQIVGKRFDDLGVFQASRAFERALPWAHKRPML